MENNETAVKKSWYDKWYKLILLIPIALVILSLIYMGFFYASHKDFLHKDITLSGGTTITLQGNVDTDKIESTLKSKFSDTTFRKLTDITTGEQIAFIIESSHNPQDLTPEIEKIVGYNLTEDNSSIEFTGPTLSSNFYKQLIIALIISFILMSIVVLILFRSFIPSIAMIFAAFSDIIMPLVLLDILEVKISAAGIAAFLMLIGYAVDDNILLTTRALKQREGTLNSRIYRAFKTGIFMTSTALFAVIPAFFIGSGLPDSFRQIFLILALGLFADIINTWLANAAIIKWYGVKKKVQ